jgi:addiction module RelE/StbE family toxin
MRIAWTRRALRRLSSIEDYISKDSPTAARRVVDAIVERTIAALRDNPNLGRPGLRKGTREFVLANLPYIVVYKVSERVEILTIRHTSQDWPIDHD